ncbi:MAG: hypothetical protein ACI8XO_001680 [Verrucomicrobiales bacterium]|jgi:hypothetical protein
MGEFGRIFFAEIFAVAGSFPVVEKSTIIKLLREAVKTKHDRMLEAARETAAGVTDPENKAENKYDTRGLEASYLAAGQGEQVEALREALQMFQPAAFPAFEPGAEIAAGALVEGDIGGERLFYLLAPRAGGISCEYEGCEVTILTPEAPLRQKLLGLKAGDAVPQPPLKVRRVL